jgi:hypothetical protein
VRHTGLRLGPLLRHVGTTTATVWVETERPCTVEVLGVHEPTFCVAGHYYALVRVENLLPGSRSEYQVRLDGEQVWPLPDSEHPPSAIRTLPAVRPDAAGPPLRLAFGSCRYAPAEPGPDPKRPDPMGPDALQAFARRLTRQLPEAWPDLLVLLGDQVYADETTPATRARIAARRGLKRPPHGEVADYEEYTWLYQEAWSESDVRWLLSTVPSVMIFDDHDVHDDWNTSRAWRTDAQRTSWWQERVVSALGSYWVYQHLGNLSPGELDQDPTYREVRASAGSGRDVQDLVRALAVAADREADGGKGYRWSVWRDLGRTRLVMVDSRCGRLLDGDRSMIGKAEFDWVADRLTGEFDHVLVGTSLPWLLPPAVHDIEVWDERLCESRRPWLARFGERLRRGADLEHWAAFRDSFEGMAGLLADVADGAVDGAAFRPPASVSVLSGDVHHSYVCRADYRHRTPAAPVYQLTCSPLHNRVPAAMRWAFRAAWSRPSERVARRLLDRVARIPRSSLDWHRLEGPLFGNAVAGLLVDGRRLTFTLEMPDEATSTPNGPQLRMAVRLELTGSGERTAPSAPSASNGAQPVEAAPSGAVTGGSADHGNEIQRSVRRQT